jgi:hypothetical protein
MKPTIQLTTLLTLLTVTCGKASPLTKSDAEKMLSATVAPFEETMHLQMQASAELTYVIQGMLHHGELKEVDAIQSFADAFPEPGKNRQSKAPPTANYNDYWKKWNVTCPIIVYRFREVSDILNDGQTDTAQVTYTITGSPVEPYYSAFRKYSPQIPQAPTTRSKKALFKRFQEGWRVINLD